MIANVSSATGEVRAETLSLHTALVFSLRSSHNLPSSFFMFFLFSESPTHQFFEISGFLLLI